MGGAIDTVVPAIQSRLPLREQERFIRQTGELQSARGTGLPWGASIWLHQLSCCSDRHPSIWESEWESPEGPGGMDDAGSEGSGLADVAGDSTKGSW